MENNWYLQECHDDDVISCREQLYKLGRFKKVLNTAFIDVNSVKNSINSTLKSGKIEIGNADDLLNNGLKCELLKMGAKGWQQGVLKIKVTLEFIPDEPINSEPESPLDELRRSINQT